MAARWSIAGSNKELTGWYTEYDEEARSIFMVIFVCILSFIYTKFGVSTQSKPKLCSGILSTWPIDMSYDELIFKAI